MEKISAILWPKQYHYSTSAQSLFHTNFWQTGCNILILTEPAAQQNQQNYQWAQQRLINSGMYPVWSEFSLSGWSDLGSFATHRVYSEDCKCPGSQETADAQESSLGAQAFCWFCHAAAQLQWVW